MSKLNQVILVMVDIVDFLIFHADHSLWLLADVGDDHALALVVVLSQNQSSSFYSTFIVEVR